MMVPLLLLLLTELWLVVPFGGAFITPYPMRAVATRCAGTSEDTAADVLEDADRRQNLFQFLLRDLQVEGVPLLGIEGADQVETMQAAVWTTMAQLWTATTTTLSQGGGEQQKACLILEELPVDALRAFVDSFANIRAEERLTQQFPALQEFDVSLVGKGVGPAILVKVGEEPKETADETASDGGVEDAIDVTPPPTSNTQRDDLIIAAMEHFVDRVVVASDDGIGLDRANTVFRVSSSSDSSADTDPCHMLSSFWNAMCELQASDADAISSIVLCLPAMSSAQHVALAELINRSLCLYRGDSVFELVHYHPSYDRTDVFPQVQPVFGHLSPTAWWPLIVEQFGGGDDSAPRDTTQLDLLVNYQRRSPVPAVILKRVSNMDAGEEEQLDLGDGSVAPANGISTFATSIARLVQQGEPSLQQELSEEVAMLTPTK